jgi:hypothetical protein
MPASLLAARRRGDRIVALLLQSFLLNVSFVAFDPKLT